MCVCLGPSVDRKRKLSSESGGMGREREGNGGREGEGERRGGRDMTYNKRLVEGISLSNQDTIGSD